MAVSKGKGCEPPFQGPFSWLPDASTAQICDGGLNYTVRQHFFLDIVSNSVKEKIGLALGQLGGKNASGTNKMAHTMAVEID